jgi:hypothetical protein
MNNTEPSVRPVINVSVMSGLLGFINGLWVVFAGTSYFSQLSPYYLIFQAIYRVAPLRSVNIVRYFLFSSGMQFILARVLGVLFGAGIGWVASRFDEELATPFIVKVCAIAGGIAGFISLGIVFLNVYAN